MKINNIKELEITEEMYERALEVENAWLELEEAQKRVMELQKKIPALRQKWVSLCDDFEKEVNKDFDTSLIITEYVRRNTVENKIEEKIKFCWKAYNQEYGDNMSLRCYTDMTKGEFKYNDMDIEVNTFEEYVDELVKYYSGLGYKF